MRFRYCSRSRMFSSGALFRCRWLLLLAAMSALAARANSIYPPAQHYGAQELWGNPESPTGLWVSSPDDPLAYV